MSLCVREWDRSGGMLDAVIPSNDFHAPVNLKGDVVRSKRAHFSRLALAPVPDQDTLEGGWNENVHLDMQGQSSNNKGSNNKAEWQTNNNNNYTPGWSNSGQETEDGVTPCKPDTPKMGATPLETAMNETVPTEQQQPPHPTHLDVVDDEMITWLQYPLDDTLERNYCSDFFGDVPVANSQYASLKESFTLATARAFHHSGGTTYNNAVMGNNRAITADAAMLMGAGRAAGLLPQAGAEAFSKVRTLHSLHSLQPSSVTRWQQPHIPNGSLKASSPTSNPMLPPKTQPVVAPVVNSQSPPVGNNNRPGSTNFSHFSRPAAMIKANLHSLVEINGGSPPNVRPKQHMGGRSMLEACTSSESSIAESTTTRLVPSVVEREQSNGIEDSRWPAVPSLSLTNERDCIMSEGDCNPNLPADQETCGRLSSVTNGAVLASSEKGASHGTTQQEVDIQEPTITSSSGGYGTSAGGPKEAAASTKRKSREREDTECQSEDGGQDESVDTKKPATGRGSTTKRSRAAEVHNQSERRRRDRINEKMRALQELIPNSNKTDKASMLDEAIEYLKMLQVQLQMMSIRTGMTLPPMVMPPGLQQHMQMPQMAAMPSMGMGMGMGMVPMGLGMRMMDMAPQGRGVMPMQPHVGSSLNGKMTAASPLVDIHGYQQPGVMDYNAYMARPHHQPMQMTQALSMDKYNAYLLQQHQFQQQQQLQQQHQQLQQQHQIQQQLQQQQLQQQQHVQHQNHQ